MAKIAEQYVVVKASKLVKNDESEELEVFSDELVETITEVVQQLIQEQADESGKSIIIECERP